MSSPRYFILDTTATHANCALWWKPMRQGYTTDLSKAGVYSELECIGLRPSDLPVDQKLAWMASVSHVPLDELRRLTPFPKPPPPEVFKPKVTTARLRACDADGCESAAYYRYKSPRTVPSFSCSRAPHRELARALPPGAKSRISTQSGRGFTPAGKIR